MTSPTHSGVYRDADIVEPHRHVAAQVGAVLRREHDQPVVPPGVPGSDARDLWSADLSHDPRVLSAMMGRGEVRDALMEVERDPGAAPRLREAARRALSSVGKGHPPGEALEYASIPPSNPDGSGLVPFSPFVPSGPHGEPTQISRELPGSGRPRDEDS